uniref:Proteophosphoglycan 5 n=1 Tax=uncultured marine virus TaxID=186617 RepID=A0A0F7KZT1_9VIRU|nr:proteophosphoglycan 5 [uncultured marine virus]
MVLTNGVPPVAKLIKFINGRAYWAGIEGSDGVLTFAQADYEESWDALNQKQVDSSRWSPIVGIGGQRGAVHVYTRDSIFRAIDGGGDILTFQFGLVVSGVGAIDQHTLLEIDGNELFMSRDGLFAFNGATTQMIGAASEGSAIGIPGINRGADPRSVPMWAVWDPRRHIAMWFFRDIDDTHPTGSAICMSRRINDNASWSTLDFYDVSAATEFESIDGIPGVMLLDSMGYAWELVDPLTDDQTCLDLDGLDGVIEDGTARTLVGSWGTDSMQGHVAGDGGRGFVFMTYTVDANSVVTGYGMNRLLRTPAAAILVAGDAEGALGVWDKWVLGGFVQNMESSWGPYPAIEMPKEATLFDMGYSPLAGEDATIVFEGVSAVAGRNMNHEMSATASRVKVDLDKGYLEGIPLRLESRFRAFRYSVQYFGTQNFDVAEIVLRWNPEGGARGPGGG